MTRHEAAKLNRWKRCRLRKQGVDVPKFKPGKQMEEPDRIQSLLDTVKEPTTDYERGLRDGLMEAGKQMETK